MTDHELPKFDLPVDFVATDEIPVTLLQNYARFPCKIKACLFVLCTTGEVRATVNLRKQTIRAGDFVTLLPGSFIQIETISDDIHLYMAGFSSEFMARSNYLKQVVDYYYNIIQYPSLPLPPRIARLYADACGVTLPHFCSAVKRGSGHTALTLINNVLIMHAKEQLSTTRKPVKEIAFALGFANPSHFNRFFREHTGVTPQAYRGK